MEKLTFVKIKDFFYNLLYNKKDLEIAALNVDRENIINDLNILKSKIKEDKESNLLINEYPSKLVYYKGRVLPNSNKLIDVPVTVLITPNDMKIQQDLKDWKLYRTNEDTETLIPKIYKKVMETYFSYEYDSNVWGLNEFWEFPFELFAKYPTGKFNVDCDSMAILLVSYIRASGVPAGYVWVVAGECPDGTGHATVYCLSKKDNKYRHINSTSKIFHTNLSEYPTHADAESGSDDMGIKETWLSFNDICSRSTFSTEDLEKLMSKSNK